jgi:PAS domain S-box-containing protein
LYARNHKWVPEWVMTEPSAPPDRIRQILGGIEKLPMLPAVAVRLLEVTEDEKSSALDLARLIETDQALAAKTMRMANSAYYGRSGKISTLRDAVALVGFGALRSTILTVFFMDVFKGTANDSGFDTEAFWLHSLACAICAREIGRKIQGPASFAEEAFVCGMLHDTGKILLNNYLPGDYKEVVDAVATQNLTIAEAEQTVLDADHAQVGSELLRLWRLPEHETRAVQIHHQPPGEKAGQDPGSRLAEVVRLADTIVRIHKIGSGGDEIPRFVEPRALASLGLTKEEVSQLAAELDDKVWEAAQTMGVQKDEKKSYFDLLTESNRERVLMRSLSLSEGKYRLLFDSFSDALFLLTDVIHECNDQACQLLGCERGEIVDQALTAFLPPSQPDGRGSAEYFQEKAREVLAGSPQTFDCRVMKKGGSVMETEVSLKAFPAGGRNALQAVLRDVTERKRAEERIRTLNGQLEQKVRERTAELEKAYKELKELDEMKDVFLSSVSHELRTPLTSIRSFSEILLRYDEEDPQTRKEFLEVIHNESKRLTRLIDDVLDLSKIESGRMVWHDELLSLEEVFQCAIRDHAPHLETKSLHVSLPPSAGFPLAFADKERVRQVVTNLLENAIKFSPEGSQILIEIDRPPDPPEEGANGWVRVSIKDQGVGIDEKDFEIIFDRFVQVSPKALYDKPKGTGLGLSICKEIIAHYGGRIGLMSEKGKGCSFFFTLPTGQ